MTGPSASGRLAGKVALVTGGARGLGRTVSEHFAAEGCAVVMAGRSVASGEATVAAIRARGGHATFVPTDVTEVADVERVVERAVGEFGALTTLVNNAAGADLGNHDGDLVSIEPGDWDRLMRVNLTAAYLCCRAVIPRLMEAGGGSIVSVSSLAAVMGLRDMAAYSTAKSGLHGMMRSVSIDYGIHHIRANTVVLGVVPHDHLAFINDGRIGDSLRSVHAVPYLGVPEDLAHACVYLCSDDARFVTGAELRVDGGASRIPHRPGRKGVYNTLPTA